MNEEVGLIANELGVNYINLVPLIYPESKKKCHIINDKGMMLYDDNHCTYDGQYFFGKEINKTFFKFKINLRINE